MTRRRQIEWLGRELECGDFHVVPIRRRRRDIGRRLAVRRNALLGHVMDGLRCWCKPEREIRVNGTLLITHRDLPS